LVEWFAKTQLAGRGSPDPDQQRHIGRKSPETSHKPVHKILYTTENRESTRLCPDNKWIISAEEYSIAGNQPLLWDHHSYVLQRACAPHFHADYSEFKAEIAIDTLEILKGKLPNRVLGLVLEWAVLLRNEFQADWEQARNIQPLEPIQQLE